jgi:hypothetical protein
MLYLQRDESFTLTSEPKHSGLPAENIMRPLENLISFAYFLPITVPLKSSFASRVNHFFFRPGPAAKLSFLILLESKARPPLSRGFFQNLRDLFDK